MGGVKRVFTLITPFQKKIALQLFGEELKAADSLVLVSEYIQETDDLGETKAMNNYKFSLNQSLKAPLASLAENRKKMVAAQADVEAIAPLLSDSFELFIGTDKDVFTQLFLSYYSERIKRVSAFDEGMGYYAMETGKDKLLKLLYPSVSSLLFGKKLRYIRRLGTHPSVNQLHLRHPELIQNKQPSVTYSKIPFDGETGVKEIEEGQVLLFSFPEQDLAYSAERKIQIQRSILEPWVKAGKKIVIKPHPREAREPLIEGMKDWQNIEVMDSRFTGESLNYYNFERVINFFSSVILDMLDKGYPIERIETWGFTPNPPVDFGPDFSYNFIERNN